MCLILQLCLSSKSSILIYKTEFEQDWKFSVRNSSQEIKYIEIIRWALKKIFLWCSLDTIVSTTKHKTRKCNIWLIARSCLCISSRCRSIYQKELINSNHRWNFNKSQYYNKRFIRIICYNINLYSTYFDITNCSP